MMKYTSGLLFLFIFCASCGQNQTNLPQDNIKSSSANYSESQLKEADTSRVPVSMVRNVKQARNGDILIASFLGVFRYDGTSFTNLTSEISPPRVSSFWDVLEDRKGNLWFGTRDSGVYHYDGKSFQHFTTKQGLASNTALHIYEDKTGIIWIAAGGLTRFDGKSFQNFTMKDGLTHNGINTIMEDKTGKLWIGTGGNVFIYNGKTFTTFTNNGTPFKNVRSIIEDKKGNIWLGGSDGLWRYHGSTFTNFTQNFVGHIYEDRKGNIWITGEVNFNVWKLLRYDQKTLYNKEPTVAEIMSTEKMLCGILEANDGSIWFGSLSGVYRYDGKTITDFKSKEGQK